MQGLNTFRRTNQAKCRGLTRSVELHRVFSMNRGRFIYVSRLILKFNVKNSGGIVQASSFFDQKHVQSKKTIRMYSSSSFFVQTRLRTRSSSFLVQVAPQRVPGHPEAKSCQNLIRNGLLEAILEASQPASKPASQAQPLGRVFSTKRARGQDRRVFSSRLVPKGSLDVRRPKTRRSCPQARLERKNSSLNTS